MACNFELVLGTFCKVWHGDSVSTQIIIIIIN